MRIFVYLSLTVPVLATFVVAATPAPADDLASTRSSAKAKNQWYVAPRPMQIIDSRPALKSVANPASSTQLHKSTDGVGADCIRPGAFNTPLRSRREIMQAGTSSKKALVSSVAKTPAPEAGIKLLEDILARVRNVPQLAMAKQGIKYQAEQNASAQQQGPTDYRLAIRPQEQIMQPAVKRNNTVLAWSPQQTQRLDNAFISDGENAGFTGRQFAEPQPKCADTSAHAALNDAPDKNALDVLAKPEAQFQSKGLWERDTGKAKPTNRKETAGDPVAGSGAVGLSNAQGIWERERAKAESALGRLSPESRDRLANSANKLFNLAQGLEAAQSSVDQKAAAPANEEAKVRGGMLAKKSRYTVQAAPAGSQSADKLDRPNWYQAPRSYQLQDERPTVRDFRESPALTGDTKFDAQVAGGGGAGSGGSPPRSLAAAKPKGALFGKALRGGMPMGSLNTIASAAPPASHPAPMPVPMAAASVPSAAADSFSPERRALARIGKDQAIEVALLPPNVVTGIPLVHLGYSEAQTKQALANLQGAEQKTSSGWTVLTFNKPGTTDSALQVYTRHGQVEALRIFDAQLVGPEFGVGLGDDLLSVKLKFGEPTFILSEPYSGVGQNYVYPISQVAFQLSRPSRGQKPQVVSMLIFNVK